MRLSCPMLKYGTGLRSNTHEGCTRVRIILNPSDADDADREDMLMNPSRIPSSSAWQADSTASGAGPSTRRRYGTGLLRGIGWVRSAGFRQLLGSSLDRSQLRLQFDVADTAEMPRSGPGRLGERHRSGHVVLEFAILEEGPRTQ